MRIVQISDTHISHLGGASTDNFRLIVDFVNNQLRPDLIVNSGDVVILTPDSPEDREAAHKLHEGFDAPVRVVPGNHDLGESGAHAWMGLSATSDRVHAFTETFGPDHFVERPNEDWVIIGMNSEILGTGIPEEEEQWKWLEDLATEIEGKSVLLFLHRPFWFPVPHPDPNHQRAIDEAHSDRILHTLRNSRLACVGSGHVHVYSHVVDHDILNVSSPSTAFIVKSPDRNHLFNQLGIVEYVIEGQEIEAFFRSIPRLYEDEPTKQPEFLETMKQVVAANA